MVERKPLSPSFAEGAAKAHSKLPFRCTDVAGHQLRGTTEEHARPDLVDCDSQLSCKLPPFEELLTRLLEPARVAVHEAVMQVKPRLAVEEAPL